MGFRMKNRYETGEEFYQDIKNHLIEDGFITTNDKQESVLDKIKEEIEQFADAYCSGDDINIYDVFQIIDKYRAESED